MSKSGTLDYKCPNCDAILKFDPHGQNWKCEYCKSEYTLEQLKEYEKKAGKKELSEEHTTKMEKDANGMDIYICNNCGAQIVADENTSATFCVYCKNTAILKNKLVDEFNPSYVIPFKFTKEDAIEKFKTIGKGKPLMPKIFNDPKNIEETKGIYIPFWLYDINTSGSIEADCKRITSWTSGNYHYTKTDVYLAKRSGNMNYSKIPVDGSTHFDDAIMNSIEPFNYEELISFTHSYLSGFLAEKYDVVSDEALKVAFNRAENSTINTLKNDIKGYTSVSIKNNDIKKEKTKDEYVLLPVWLLNVKFKDKIYTFAMNGQTGKMIGDIPIDTKKAIMWWVAIFGICMILFIILYFVGVIG